MNKDRTTDFTLLVCDSGLGCIDIARRLMAGMRKNGAPARHVEIICFNAWPEPGRGYNQLPNMAAKTAVFRNALAGMIRLRPDALIVGCNTLSVVREISGVGIQAPAAGITGAAERLLYDCLSADPKRLVVLLGTETTVGSGFYRDRLTKRGIPPERIIDMPCPDLAPRIEAGPERPEIAAEIRGIARRLLADHPELRTDPAALGLCCTHYGYAKKVWEREFSAEWGTLPLLLDPNEALPAAPEVRSLISGNETPEFTAQVCSRVPLGDRNRHAIAGIVGIDEPELARALLECRSDPGLFDPF